MIIHSAFELGGYGGKVTIYLRNGKGDGKKFLRGGGGREMLNGWYIKKLQLLQLLQYCNIAILQ